MASKLLLTEKEVKLYFRESKIYPIKLAKDISSLHLFATYPKTEAVKQLAELLKNNKELIEVFVNQCDIDATGAKYLAESLKFNSQLTLLNIANNNIGNAGIIAFADALLVNSTLTSLIINDCNIKEEGGRRLVAALKQNNSIVSFGSYYCSGSNDISVATRLEIDQLLAANNNKQFQQKLQPSSSITDSYTVNPTYNLTQIVQQTISSGTVFELQNKIEKLNQKVNKLKRQLQLSANRGSFHPSNVELKAQLGEGSYGKVYKAQINAAIKEINTSAFSSEQLRDLKREIQILSSIPTHPNVVTYYGHFVTNKVCYIGMELCSKYDLHNILHEENPFIATSEHLSSSTVLYIIKQLATGLQHLHDNGITHRDIKPKNVVLKKKDNPTSTMSTTSIDDLLLSYEYKWADFGCAALKALKQQTATAVLLKQFTAPVCNGTFAYAAPEILCNNESISRTADIYSFGCVIWSILTRKVPHEKLNLLQLVTTVYNDKKHEIIPNFVNDKYRQLLLKCWHVDPLQRISIDKIIEELEQIEL